MTAVMVMAAGLMPAAAAQMASGSDKAIASRIEGRLQAAPTLKRDHITVAVAGGVVTLTGRVGTAVRSARAAALSKVAGVSRVDNKLKIDPALARSPRRPGQRDEPETTAAGSPGAAAATREAAGSVADAVTDAWIVTKLHAGFVNEPALENSDIHVESSRHIVTLSGTVMTAAGRLRAVQIAKTTKGVSQVVDTLTVGPKRPRGGA
ncbi:MAG: BON domain-containing protein [Acidobacteriota bacterium]